MNKSLSDWESFYLDARDLGKSHEQAKTYATLLELQDMRRSMWVMVNRGWPNNDPGFMAVAMKLDEIVSKLNKETKQTL